jgi:recombination protein RecA
MPKGDKGTSFKIPKGDRGASLDLALSQIERHFGKGAVMRLGEISHQLEVGFIPTGSPALDLALGIGGVPRGRVTEVFGAEASGKTTMTLHVIAEAQRMGGTCAFIDAEHALDPGYAKRLGVDVDNLLISQPDYAEQSMEITDYLVRSGAIDAVVIDSVAALVPKAELEGDMGDTHVGLQARVMSQALRKLTSSISSSNTAVIFINQLREKIGVMYGSPETTPGGRALKFYSTVRIDMRRIEGIKQGTEILGNRVRARIVKNKVAPPFKVAEFDIMFGQGISKEGDLVDIGVNLGPVKKSGAFYSFGEIRLGQGREAAKQYLKEHPETAAEIEESIQPTISNEGTPQKIEPTENDQTTEEA